MENITRDDTVKIMELVAEITAAVVVNEHTVWHVEEVDKLVRTLFPTMCDLLEKANERRELG